MTAKELLKAWWWTLPALFFVGLFVLLAYWQHNGAQGPSYEYQPVAYPKQLKAFGTKTAQWRQGDAAWQPLGEGFVATGNFSIKTGALEEAFLADPRFGIARLLPGSEASVTFDGTDPETATRLEINFLAGGLWAVVGDDEGFARFSYGNVMATPGKGTFGMARDADGTLRAWAADGTLEIGRRYASVGFSLLAPAQWSVGETESKAGGQLDPTARRALAETQDQVDDVVQYLGHARAMLRVDNVPFWESALIDELRGRIEEVIRRYAPAVSGAGTGNDPFYLDLDAILLKAGDIVDPSVAESPSAIPLELR